MLCSILGACGPVEDFDDSSCVDTWWYLEVEDKVVLSGSHAVFQQFGEGIQGFSGDFHDGKDTVVESCGLVSQQDLAVGLHNSLTCIVSTEQGPNPSWTAAQDSEMDFRPNLVELQKNGDMISGLISGQMLYQKVLNYSTLQIETNFVNYNFEFNALKEKSIDDGYEICKKQQAKAICKCMGDTGCAAREFYYFQSNTCDDRDTRPIAQKICNGEFVRDYCPRSKGCSVKHIDVVCPAK